jgi:5-methyltetrahydrofolate--homocysteine methyltransferase
LSKFLAALQNKILLGDGALGTMLVKEGLPAGENPELWMLSHPEKVQNITCAYLAAGSDVLQTNTFGANRLKLQEYHAENQVWDINLTAARLVRAIAGDKAFVAGIIGPTGYFPAPLSDYNWSELVEVFREQAEALQEGGVDFLFLETFSDLGEARAALFAAKNYTNLPVACSLTYTNGRTLTGTDPATAAVVLEAMGADLIGANCSTGPQELLPIMEAYRKATGLPLLVEPNAGLPELIDGQTIYRETPAQMAQYVKPFLRLGVRLMGACCGSTPAHLQAMRAEVDSFDEEVVPRPAGAGVTRLASRTHVVTLGPGVLPRLIGERINPTARKVIAEAYREQKWDTIVQEGLTQIEKGAELLDLNVGVPGLDEGELLAQGVRHLQMALDVPLVLDCTDPVALEKGLQEYQGKALINSVNGEDKSLDTILPLAKKYGAAVIGLTLDENGIPDNAADRFMIAKKIYKRAMELGIPKEDLLIDCLVLTAAAQPETAMETIGAIKLVKKQLGLTCVLGLSNVSHGLPQRSWLNNTFLALTLGAGLDAAIANPHDPRISETLASGALLTNRDPGAAHYLKVTGKAPLSTPAAAGSSASAGVTSPSPAFPAFSTTPAADSSNTPVTGIAALQNYILQGQKEPIIPLLEELFAQPGTDPLTVVNEGLIPPLEKLGDLFGKGEVFLPQLLLAGEAAKTAFSYLQTHFPATTGQKGTIVLGTVKGDVHDIGKNIVKALLENHGYRVVDLGKNVPAEAFIAAAKQEAAQIIGLSALMTTTMVEMEKIIAAIKKEQLPVFTMVGGAVVTADYAKQIGADAYGKDAVKAVKIVQSLLPSNDS